MIKEIQRIRNGDIFMDFTIYQCDRCNTEMPESNPIYHNCGADYCPDCAFISELISEKECKRLGYYWACEPFCLEVIDGIVVALDVRRKGKKRDRRSSVEYRAWRTEVFTRDNWTCRKCSKFSGSLNAHHIKTYRDYPELRLDIDNGVTLCEKCHKEIHYGAKNEVV